MAMVPYVLNEGVLMSTQNQEYKGYIAVGPLVGTDWQSIVCVVGMPCHIATLNVEEELRQLLVKKFWVEKIICIKRTFESWYDEKSGATLMQTILHIELRLDQNIRKYYRDIVDFCDDLLLEVGAHAHYMKRLITIPIHRSSIG